MVIGYLGRDPEMRFTPNGKSVSNFSIACSRSWKGSDGEKHTETEWFNVVAWGNLAEISKKFLVKGSLAYIEGRLQSRLWKDNDGNQHKSVEIVAQEILMLSDKQDDEEELDESEGSEAYPF